MTPDTLSDLQSDMLGEILARWEKWSPQEWVHDVSDILVRHVYERSRKAFAAGDAARDALKTPEQIRKRQLYIRERLLEGIGGLPSSDAPLNARITGTVQGDGFRIEKILFESRPQHYVTVNLYIPDVISPDQPGAAVLFLCGHHREAKHHPEYQDVCQRLTRAGLIVLAQDPVGQGERLGYYDPITKTTSVSWGVTEHDHAGAQMLPVGDSLARYFLHDSLRALEYLSSRAEVDASRIGVTGNSGGGTQTSLMMMAAGDRIAAAAPTTFIMNRESYQLTGGAQDAEQIWPGFTQSGLDHEDILLSLWPRPVQVQAVTSDFFPIEGTRRTVARCRRFWDMVGAGDHFRLVEDHSSHAYTPTLANAAAQFFALHLCGAEIAPPSDDSIRPFPGESLWCTKSGQVRGEINGAGFSFEDNQARFQEIAGSALPTPEEARNWLRERVTTCRVPGDLAPRFLIADETEKYRLYSCLWRPQEDLFNLAYLICPKRSANHPENAPVPVTICLWDGGTRRLFEQEDDIRRICDSGRVALICDLSGCGSLLPRAINGQPVSAFYGTLHKLACDLLFLGDDLLSLRVYEVLRTLDLIAVWKEYVPNISLSPEGIYIEASGRVGVAGQLAALLDSRVRHVTVPESQKPWDAWTRSCHYDTTGIYESILRGSLCFGISDLL